MVLVAEGPHHVIITRLALATATQCNIRTMTMCAFSEEEMERIVQGCHSSQPGKDEPVIRT
jgi:uncharacterized protein with GYD domain